MNSLPIEAIRTLLEQAPDLATVINLYSTNRLVQEILGCRLIEINPSITKFVDNSDCNSSTLQQELFEHFNDKFDLGLIAPITFSQLLRAHNQSAANPLCDNYASIYDCLKSTAKLGLIDVFSELYQVWQDRVDYYTRLTRYSPLNEQHPQRFLIKLATIAYKHKQVRFGDHLWRQLKFSRVDYVQYEFIHKLVYFRFKAWSSVILAPYKVRRNRDIRTQHYSVLFDPDVSDDVKQDIWSTKYDFGEDTLEAQLAKYNVDSDIQDAVYIRLGIYRNPPLSNVPIRDKILYLLSLSSGDSQLTQYLENLAVNRLVSNRVIVNGIITVNSVKRGYFNLTKSVTNNVLPRFDLLLLIFGKLKPLSKFFRNFSLVELEKFCATTSPTLEPEAIPSLTVRGIINISVPKVESQETLLRGIFLGGLTEAYREYKLVHPINFPHVGSKIFSGRTPLGSVEIVNDFLTGLLSNINPTNSNYTYEIISIWLEFNYVLLAQIWQQLGRKQFEDSLLYLKINYNLEIAPVAFLEDIVSTGVDGLIAYIFGYELTAERKLIPLRTPGIILYDADFLRSSQEYREELREQLMDKGKVDTALLLIELYTQIGVPFALTD